MADGGGVWRTIPDGTAAARLGDVGVRIWAHCRCGRMAAIDPAPWRAQGLDAAPLDRLESRLRCLCGVRRVRITPTTSAEAPAGGGIWIFR
jgi:hypothetical protein